MFQPRPPRTRCLAARCLLVPWTGSTRALAEPRQLKMEDAEALPSAFPTTLVPPTTQSLRPLYERLRNTLGGLKTRRAWAARYLGGRKT